MDLASYEVLGTDIIGYSANNMLTGRLSSIHMATQTEPLALEPGAAYSSEPTNAPPRSEGIRVYRFLDGIRGASALYVMFHHALWEVEPYRSQNAQISAWFDRLQFLHYGHFAVAVFIVLSGFLLTQPVAVKGHLPGGILAFVKRRSLRILPAYYAAVIACLILITAIPGMSERGGWRWDLALPGTDLKSLLSHLTLTHTYFHKGWEIDPVLWSISVEWWIYGVFAVVLVPAYKKLGIAGLMLFAGFFTVAGLTLQPSLQPFIWLYIFLFALGALAAAITVKYSEALKQGLNYVMSGLVLVSAAAMWTLARAGANGIEPYGSIAELTVGLATSMLIIWACQASQLGKKIWLFDNRAALSIGAFSYSLYLVHWPILSSLHCYLRSRGSAPQEILAILISGGTATSILVAYLWYRVFEVPFLNLKKRTDRT